MRIRLDLGGDVQLDRELLRFIGRADDMSPILRALADNFYEIEKKQFRTEGTFSGTWEALSPNYAARKAQKYPGAKILHATGRLEDSLTREGARDAVRRVTGIHGFEMFVGTRTPYAKYHQRGTDVMPRRRPIEFSAAQRVKWVKAVQRFLVNGEVTVDGRAVGKRKGWTARQKKSLRSLASS